MKFEKLLLSNIDAAEAEISSIELSEISGLISKGDFSGAASLSRSLIEEGYFDIRLLAYYFFGCCNKDISLSGIEVFVNFNDIFENNYDIITPGKNKLKHCQKILNWFFESLIDSIEHKEKASNRLTFEPRLLEAVEHFLNQCVDILGFSFEEGQRLSRLIRDRVKVEKESTEEALVEEESSPEASIASDYRLDSFAHGATSIGSQKWYALLDKMQLFSELQVKESWLEAAALYRHIYKLLTDFNPLDYFPDHFTHFYKQAFNSNFQKVINQAQSHMGSVQWQMLESIIESDHHQLRDSLSTDNGTVSFVEQDEFDAVIAKKVAKKKAQEDFNHNFEYRPSYDHAERHEYASMGAGNDEFGHGDASLDMMR